AERAAMAKRPPHIVVTTPESLYILLTSESGRRILRTVRTVIVDEIHAVVDDRRGSHLALSLERLEALVRADSGPPVNHPGSGAGLAGTEGFASDTARSSDSARQAPLNDSDSENDPAKPGPPNGSGRAIDRSHAGPQIDARRPSRPSHPGPQTPERPASPLVRIGLSATQRPIEEVARFLVGTAWAHAGPGGAPECEIGDPGHARDLDLGIELPGSPLSAVMSLEVWKEVYDRLAALVQEHRTTLIFVGTRRLSERLARHLG